MRIRSLPWQRVELWCGSLSCRRAQPHMARIVSSCNLRACPKSVEVQGPDSSHAGAPKHRKEAIAHKCEHPHVRAREQQLLLLCAFFDCIDNVMPVTGGRQVLVPLLSPSDLFNLSRIKNKVWTAAAAQLVAVCILASYGAAAISFEVCTSASSG